MKLLLPKKAEVFHKLFSKVDKEVLNDMMSAVMKTKSKVADIELESYEDVTASGEYITPDFKVTLEDGAEYHIELEQCFYPEIIDRTTYHLESRYLAQGEKYMDYNDFKKIAVVVILDYTIENLKEFERPDTMWHISEEETGQMLTDIMEMQFFELPKLYDAYKKEPDSLKYQWLMFLNAPDSEEVMNIIKENKYIREAMNVLEQISCETTLI